MKIRQTLKQYCVIALIVVLCSFFYGNTYICAATTEVGASNESGSASSDSQEEDVSICMVGDVLLHDRVTDSGRKSDGTYCYDNLFAHVKDMTQEADVAIVNQEVILGGSKLGLSGYPTFNGPFEVGDALVKAGFDVVCHGTNHALDKGAKGITSCLDFWNTTYPDIAVLGIHDSAASQEKIYIRNVNGIRIAILNYTFSTNGISMPKKMPYAVDMLEKKSVVADLAEAEKEADFTIVCPHWGTEYEHGTTDYQVKWAKIFADNGADLVIGTHPHVIEPVGSVEKPDGTKMIVYYSIGNFVNATSGTGNGTADRMLGAMARITIGRDSAGKVYIKAYDAVPLICHLESGYGGITTYPMDEYTTELASRNNIRRQDSSFSLEYCKKLWDKVMLDGE